MAFSVTPTSGAAPYTLSAIVADSDKIDNVLYTATLRTSSNTGSCLPEGAATLLDSSVVASLLADGSVEYGSTVNPGSCRSITLRILRVSDNAVVSSSTVFVDNV